MKKIFLSSVFLLSITVMASAQESNAKSASTEQEVKARQQKEAILRKEAEHRKREKAEAEKNLIKTGEGVDPKSEEGLETEIERTKPKEKQKEVRYATDSKAGSFEAKAEEPVVAEKKKDAKKGAVKTKKKK